MKIKINVSTERHSNKVYEPKTLLFREQELTPKEIFDLALQGYAFANIFSKSGSLLTMREKTVENFLSTNVIWVDVDDSPISAMLFIDSLSIRPSMVYSTYDNGMDDMCKFRMAYFLTEPVTDAGEYRELATGLCNDIATTIMEKFGAWCGVDHNSTRPELYMNGTYISMPSYKSKDPKCGIIYYVENLFHHKSIFEFGRSKELMPSFRKHRKKADNRKEYDPGMSKCENEYLRDFFDMLPSDFLTKYGPEYGVIRYRTDNLVYDDFLHIYKLPEDGEYAEVTIPWDYEKNCSVRFCGCHGSSGRQSHLTMFHRSEVCAWVAGLFNTIYGDEMTIERMLYVMMDYAFRFIKTSDWRPKSTNESWKKKLYDICRQAVGTSRKVYGTIGSTPRKYIVDKSWCRLKGIKPADWRNKVETMTNMLRIFPYYDFDKSINANLKALKTQGITCSKSSICKYLRDIPTANYVLGYLGLPLLENKLSCLTHVSL